MSPRRRLRATRAAIPLFLLTALLVQLAASAAGTAGAAPRLTNRPLAGAAKGAALQFANYDIRVSGGGRLAALLEAYVPGGASGLASAARSQRALMLSGQARLRAAPGAEVAFSPQTGAAELVRGSQGPLTPPAPGQASAAIVLGFLRANQALYGLSDQQIDGLRMLGESRSRASGLRMVRMEQQVGGLPVFQSDTRFILDRDGRLVRSVGLLNPAGAIVPKIQPISAPAALQAALAAAGIAIPAEALTVASSDVAGAPTEVMVDDPRIAGPVSSRLVYFPAAPGLLVPAWAQVIFTSGAADWYTLVDAGSGELLWRKNIRADGDPGGAPAGTSARASAPAAWFAPGFAHSTSARSARPQPARAGLAASTQPARFSVYVQGDGKTPADSPAPQSPTSASPGAGTQPAEIARTIVSMQSVQDSTASPAGWIPDGGTTTTGNNADAYLDRTGGADTDIPDTDPASVLDGNGRPAGNPDAASRNRDFLGNVPRSFDYFPPPQAGNPEAGQTATGDGSFGTTAIDAFRRGSVTQLFYTANWYHDQLYRLGFDEAAGNFQLDNFGRGGAGGDRVLAEAQDSSGTNNANFSTPPDGTSGRMQMYRFTGPTISRDGGLDSEIVIHELTHGLSNRLIGNGGGLLWDVGAGMGEGWSDFYALSLLNNTNADDPNGKYAAGAYATYKIANGYTDNYLYGIRRFPYSTDNSVNPLTWADVDDTTASTSGGIAVSPLGFQNNGALEVHNVGELWALTLWEIRSRIIADPAGANGDVPTGNRTMLQLVTDAMKLTPLNPTVIEARDALLDADCAANACANERWIWGGFADRGLGAQAVAPVSRAYGYRAGHMGVGESFVLPNLDVQAVTIDDSAGNHNGAIDPGEPIKLTVSLKNPWRGAARGVASATTTLTAQTAGVTVFDGSAAYGAIPAQGSASGDTFMFTVPTGAGCGQPLKFTLATASALGASTRSITLRVGQAAGTAAPITYTRSSVGLAIPDNRPTGVVDTLSIADDYQIADVNLRINSLTHTFTGDVTAMLKGPNGYGADLVSLIGWFNDHGSGQNITNMVIDDQASNDMASATSAAAPYSTSWRPIFNTPSLNGQVGPIDPVGQLSRFNGLSTQGDWKLLVSDQQSADIGTLNGWSLIVTPRAFSCAPFTPAAALIGTKSVAGSFVAGGTISYTVTLTNTGTAPQADNAGNEFADVLPAQLTLVSASASAGTAAATIGSNTVTWNGALAPLGGAAKITIIAIINPGADGATISNQGTLAFDADGNGTNEATAVTDDPRTAAAGDPTKFVVGAAAIRATSAAELLDQNGNGAADAGEIIRYTVIISNTDGSSATGVTFDSGPLDTNAPLVAGSAATSQGNITTGDAPGDTTVAATLGGIPAGGSVTLTFQVKVSSPLPDAVTQISNQGTVAGSNFAPMVTDDPRTLAVGDATVVQLARRIKLFMPLVLYP
jgi:uncharacterized repeat protein (TIGR01451 family)